MSFQEIAAELGMTRTQVVYIYMKAIRKCQQKFERRGLTCEDFELGRILSVSSGEAEVSGKSARRGIFRSD